MKDRYSIIQCLFILFILVSCIKPPSPSDLLSSRNGPSYGYTPLDPLPAFIDPKLIEGEGEKADYSLINTLSDETMRIAIGSSHGSAGVTYGQQVIGTKGNRYVVVLDYIKYLTKAFPVIVTKDSSGKHIENIQAFDENDSDETISDMVEFITNSKEGQITAVENVVPIYIGVGLRITADVQIRTDSLNLDLFGLGVAASQGKASGTLVVQTLGVTGENISALIPVASELNKNTIENAIMSLGAIKAKMYESKTILAPKVLGFYNNIGGQGMETTVQVISTLLSKPIIIDEIYLQRYRNQK